MVDVHTLEPCNAFREIETWRACLCPPLSDKALCPSLFTKPQDFAYASSAHDSAPCTQVAWTYLGQRALKANMHRVLTSDQRRGRRCFGDKQYLIAGR